MKLLKRDEGMRLYPYLDSTGWWTIGIGHLIDRRRGGSFPPWLRSVPITEDEAGHLLATDLLEREARLAGVLPWLEGESEACRLVLSSMAFQLGVAGVLDFRDMLAAAEEKRWADAGREMRASLWYRQTPQRAERLARTMETGDVAHLELGPDVSPRA